MIIEVRIGNNRYKINCRAEESDKILEFADRLDARVRDISDNIEENITAEKLLVIAGLTLEQELQNKNEQISGDSQQQFYNEEEFYEALSKQTENLINYIKKITHKIVNS